MLIAATPYVRGEPRYVQQITNRAPKACLDAIDTLTILADPSAVETPEFPVHDIVLCTLSAHQYAE